jgi:surface antigen
MKTRHLRWAGAVVLGVLAAAVLGLALPAHAADDYPYRGRDPSELDRRGFYYRHCTSFVAWRLSQRGPFDNYMNGGHWYHARNWADNAQRLGFPVDSRPAVGAVAHWYPGEGDADGLGHVALVESVNADGSVYVEEYNGYQPYEYARRGPIRAGRYIHIYDVASSVTPRPAAAAPVVAAVGPVRPKPVDPGPVGHLTSPVTNVPLRPGDRVSVRGMFTDDARVAKVHFFAADEHYRWTLVGTDAHGGNGEYSVEWTVDYPAGSHVSLYAEAFDAAGNPAVDTIRGLEGIAVATASEPVTLAAQSKTRAETDARSRTGVYIAVAVLGCLALNAAVSFERRRRRVRAIRLAWRRSAA